MKKVYILRTSEDGNIAVFTNVKKVYEGLKMMYGVNFPYTYTEVLKSVRDFYGFFEVDGTHIEVEQLYLNNL
jgi:hypothetical protein